MSSRYPSTARGARAPVTCRWCGQALSALARVRGDVCDAMDCRRSDTNARAQTQRAANLEAERAAAARAWNLPALATAPVLWLRHHADDFAPPHGSDIAGLRAHLMEMEGDDRRPPSDAGDAMDEAASAPVAGQLCALCRGRCCRQGLDGKAFLEPHHLRAWLEGQPHASWADAVDHYLGFIGPEHLQASCLFHAAHGCTLPRERRSDVCNQFECTTLDQLRDIAASQPDAVVVVGIVASHASHVAHGAAMVSARGTRMLPGQRERE